MILILSLLMLSAPSYMYSLDDPDSVLAVPDTSSVASEWISPDTLGTCRLCEEIVIDDSPALSWWIWDSFRKLSGHALGLDRLFGEEIGYSITEEWVMFHSGSDSTYFHRECLLSLVQFIGDELIRDFKVKRCDHEWIKSYYWSANKDEALYYKLRLCRRCGKAEYIVQTRDEVEVLEKAHLDSLINIPLEEAGEVWPDSLGPYPYPDPSIMEIEDHEEF